MRTRHWAAVAATLALATAPAAAQEGHRHDAGSGSETAEDMAGMCHTMMDGEDMMGGQGMMMGGRGMMMGTEGMSHMMQGMSGMSGMPHGMNMMPGAQPGPATLLGAAEQLGLDDEQRERLEALNRRSEEIHEAHMAASAVARQEAAAMMGGETPDLDAYEQALWEAAQHMVTAQLGMVRLGFEARSVLTADQLERMGEGMASTGSTRCSMMGGEMDAAEGHREHHR